MWAMRRWLLAVGALYGAVGVGAGALGAHWLRARVSAASFENFQQAVSYFLVHGVLLVALSAYVRRHARRAVGWCAGGFVLGTALFAGGLMIWSIANVAWVRPLIPCGGTLLIAAWLGLLVAAFMDSTE